MNMHILFFLVSCTLFSNDDGPNNGGGPHWEPVWQRKRRAMPWMRARRRDPRVPPTPGRCFYEYVYIYIYICIHIYIYICMYILYVTLTSCWNMLFDFEIIAGLAGFVRREMCCERTSADDDCSTGTIECGDEMLGEVFRRHQTDSRRECNLDGGLWEVLLQTPGLSRSRWQGAARNLDDCREWIEGRGHLWQ